MCPSFRTLWCPVHVECLLTSDVIWQVWSRLINITFYVANTVRSSGHHRVWCYTGVETKYPPNIKYEIIKTLHVAWRPLHLETARIYLQIFSSYPQIFSVHWEVCGEFISTRPVTKNVNTIPGYGEIAASSRETWGISREWRNSVISVILSTVMTYPSCSVLHCVILWLEFFNFDIDSTSMHGF